MDKNRFSWNLSVWSEKLRKLGNGRQRLLILFLAGLLAGGAVDSGKREGTG